MKVTIHQPNFFPWYPYFEKMQKADVFVLLTHCQFEKNGFQNRFQRNGMWNSMSTFRGLDPLVEKKFVSWQRDWKKIKKRNHDFDLEFLDDCFSDSLCETNCRIIEKLASIICPSVKIIRDWQTDLKATERLVDIVQKVGGTEYISGPSGPKYMNMDLWKEANIKVTVHQNNEKIHSIDFLRKKNDKI